ncbi:MAG: type II and III secretion system protein [Elusimicrobia bacterium]|nr:type II and III secretion system protein [Candidatus Liberimonas magnetica]
MQNQRMLNASVSLLMFVLFLFIFAVPCLSSEMIEVEIEITEINNNKANELGIQWADTLQAGEISWEPSFVGTKRIPAALPEVPSLIDAGDWKRYTALTASLKILKQKGAAQVLSKPKLVTKSGTTADFLVGGEVPIVASGVGGGTINWKEFGLKMIILPKITHDNQIDVSMTTEVSRLDWSNAVAGNPAITSRKATSQLVIKNGQTLALAGMIETKKEKQKTGIPLLMDIPILGYLFSRQIDVDTKTNVLIFVTPKIIE